ncbi:MAG: Holliday junction branch migration protein RuvA [Bacteroidetes bacterium]|uniref:Holliday junction branch migration complex subunit RuvA n=1 Tax=Candidatus Gallipaludibacter merdavium TaxID=2840839 RepID=A0A9D9HUZ7_9BACT|nr:Holliday junction branch migration protein RuvA [Candidatus Gallipaludibacter merdavium]
MIDYIKGSIAELTPTYAVIETNGIGYGIHIALTTYSALGKSTEAKLYVHEVIREDAHLLFGFMNKGERALFLLLISVSGIGANTARMILSSYTAGEIRQIIATGNAKLLSSIKGIGPKTAQRIIVELKDKILKVEMDDETQSTLLNEVDASTEGTREEAIAALTMLGFASAPSTKVVNQLLKEDPQIPVEQVIKRALKML